MAKKLAISFAVIALVLLGGTSYVYFSPNVTAGRALYPVKTGLENMKLSWANTPIKKVVAYTALANRRLAETLVLADELSADPNAFSLVRSANAAEIIPTAESNGPLVATIRAITANVTSAIGASREITDSTVALQAISLINQSAASQEAGLKEVASQVGTLVKPSVIEAVAEAIDKSAADQVKTKTALNEVKQKIAKGEKKIKLDLKSAGDIEEDDLKKIKEDEDINATEEIAAELAKDLVEAKDEIDSLKAKLAAAGISTEETAKLLEHLDSKLAQAEAALADNNLNQAYGLLHALDAMANNAKHFLKKVDKAQALLEKSEREIEEEAAENEDADSQNEADDEAEEALKKQQELANEEAKQATELTNEQNKQAWESANEEAKQTQELQTENTKETE